MATTNDDGQPTLFGEGSRPRKAPKPPTDTDTTYAMWQAAWTARHGAPPRLPSIRAMLEVKHQCKRLAQLVLDPEIRASFLDAWLRTNDRYVVEHDWPLRLALADSNFSRLLRTAEREVYTGRQNRALDAEPATARPPVATRDLHLPRWTATIVSPAGVVVTREFRATTKKAAEGLASEWLLAESAARPRSLGLSVVVREAW